MIKTKISKNLYQYQFPPRSGKHYGFNIFALVHGNNALLIDAGFEDHASMVKTDLLEQSIEPSKVVISHFHDDHIYGLQVLKGLQVLGSEKFQTVLDLYTPVDKHTFFTPTDKLNESTSLEFGEFQISLRLIPGHSACGVYTVIDDQYIHIGDDIMCSNDGDPILPSCEFERVSEHIDSLKELKNYNSLILLMGHGKPLKGESNINQAIDNRLAYLRAIKASTDKISYDEATENCSCDFLHKEWHEFWWD